MPVGLQDRAGYPWPFSGVFFSHTPSDRGPLESRFLELSGGTTRGGIGCAWRSYFAYGWLLGSVVHQYKTILLCGGLLVEGGTSIRGKGSNVEDSACSGAAPPCLLGDWGIVYAAGPLVGRQTVPPGLSFISPTHRPGCAKGFSSLVWGLSFTIKLSPSLTHFLVLSLVSFLCHNCCRRCLS